MGSTAVLWHEEVRINGLDPQGLHTLCLLEILLRERVSGTKIWRQAGVVKGEVCGNCRPATLYTSSQFSPTVMLLWL